MRRASNCQSTRAEAPVLEHGADPNLAWADPGDAPLHIAAQRWDVPMVELLVRHGADIHLRRRDGRTAHTLAALHGNQEIAAWLLAHGAKDELSALDIFVSACTRAIGRSLRGGSSARIDVVLQRAHISKTPNEVSHISPGLKRSGSCVSTLGNTVGPDSQSRSACHHRANSASKFA